MATSKSKSKEIPNVLNAQQVLHKFEDELREKHGAFFARKVVFLAGFKTSTQLLRGQSKENEFVDRAIELLGSLMAKEVLADIADHYEHLDESGHLEVSKAMIAEVEKLLVLLVGEAKKAGY